MKKTSFLSAIISATTILSSVIIDKIVAMYSGAQGLVVISQFKNLFSIVRTLSNGAINDGVVKYSSQHQNTSKLDDYLSSAFKITIIFSIIIGLCLVFFSKTISQLVLYTEDYYYYFIALGVSLPMIGFYDLLMSAIIGLKKIKDFYKISLSTQLVNIVVTLLLTYKYGLTGAFTSIIVNLVFGCVVLFFYLKKDNWFSVKKIRKGFVRYTIKGYTKFFIITVSVMVISPLIFMIHRDFIISKMSIDQAGYWQAMFRIYSVSVIFIQTTMRRYLLPKFSSLTKKVEIKKTINKSLKMIFSFLFLTILAMSLLKEFIIEILFTKDFLVISSIFELTLVISFFEILGWVYSVWMISKEKYIGFSFSIILFGVSFIFFTNLFIDRYLLRGVVYAFFVSKVIKMLFNYMYYKKTVSKC